MNPAPPSKKSFGSKDPKNRPIVKAFLILTVARDPLSEDGKGITTSCKYVWKSVWKSNHDEDEDSNLDENAIDLMCFPDGLDAIFDICNSKKVTTSYHFHSFLVTRETGSRYFGSCLLFANETGQSRETSIHAFCILTTIPFVVVTEKLLRYFVLLGPDSQLIPRICRLRLPAKGKCIKLLLPPNPRSQVSNLNLNEPTYVFRGTSDFPLLDHSLRKLLCVVLNSHNLILAVGAALLEFQVLVISNDYQEMMLVAESLTTLLLPFQWQHVYVPILPSKLGLHYLDVPTPYIMGINARVFSTASSSFPSLTTHTSQLRIFCGENRVEFIPGSDLDVESSTEVISLPNILPHFLFQLSEDVDIVLRSSNMKLIQNNRVRSKSESTDGVTEVAQRPQGEDAPFDYLDDMKLNHILRVLFTTTLEQNLLRDCDKFVVSSSSSSANSSSRQEGVRFDSVSFLSDQPENLIPFFKKFLQTQMFASLIDSRYRANYRDKLRPVPTNMTYGNRCDLNAAGFSMQSLTQLTDSVDKVFNGAFEDATVVDLNESDISKSCLSPRTQRKVYKNLHSVNNNVSGSSLKMDLSSVETMLGSGGEVTSEGSESKGNHKIVESLLRDTRIKTKRILLEKIGGEGTSHPGFGSAEDVIEGNALIASLCDLIEKVWTHGKISNVQLGSFFWYALSESCTLRLQNTNDGFINMSTLGDTLMTGLNQLTSSDKRGAYSLLSQPSSSVPSSPMKSRTVHSPLMQHLSLVEPLPKSLCRDFLSVQRMTDVKTDIGKSRAFIRLALERKSLSQHLKELLDQEEVKSSYEEFAFLRCEEERDQFLAHLLTLNAVDLLCFTNSFTTTFLNYRIYVYGSGPFSGFFTLSGTLNSSNQTPIEVHGRSFVFTTKNLGLLKFMNLSCSFTSKVFVDFVIVRNEETGHVFKFSCNHWFGRNVEDDAMERILVAEHVHDYREITDVIKRDQNRTSSIGRQLSRRGITFYDSRKEIPLDKLQLILKERMNEVVRCCLKDCLNSEEEDTLEITLDHSAGEERPNGTLTRISSSTAGDTRKFSDVHPGREYQLMNHLLFSEPHGIISVVKECLYVGFRNRSKYPFRKRFFLWDYILRIQMELKLSWKTLDSHLSSVNNDPNVTPSRKKVASRSDRKFIDIVDNINSIAVFWGKDGKLCLFLVIAMRDRLLSPHFIRLLSWPSLAKQFFDPVSFVTDNSLMMMMIQILSKTNEIDLPIDVAATKGL